MNIETKIEKTVEEICQRQVTLNELLIAGDVIEHQIVKLRSEIESYGEYLGVLKDERRRECQRKFRASEQKWL